MRLVPETVHDKIAFFEAHVATWSANAQSIGTTLASVDDVAAKAVAAREAVIRQQAAIQAARTATQELKMYLDALSLAGAAVVSEIRAKAKSAGPDVYLLASIPAPDAPSTLGPPGLPTGFTSSAQQNGVLTLRWTCRNPRGAKGTMYHVSRQTTDGGPFVFLGSVGKKQFADETLPAGTAMATYQVQGFRSTAVGPIAHHVVHLGVSDGHQALLRMARMTTRAA